MKKFILLLGIIFMVVIMLFGNTILKYFNNRPRTDMDNSIQPQETTETDTPLVAENPELFFHKPQAKPASTSIQVYKELRVLELYGDGVMIGRFKIALGGNPTGNKNKEGDSRTPEGDYYICTRNAQSRFTLFLGLSYPNIEDAQRGLENQSINSETFKNIKKAIEQKQRPPWNTPLGGAVGIHGKGNEYDWTLGCIAMSDEDIKILWEYTPLNMPVKIFK